jgi:hypothetical protein
MAWWLLGARNQLNRAKISLYLLKFQKREFAADGEQLLQEMKELRRLTELNYQTIIKPTRRAQMMHWIYDSCQYAMESAIPIMTQKIQPPTINIQYTATAELGPKKYQHILSKQTKLIRSK